MAKGVGIQLEKNAIAVAVVEDDGGPLVISSLFYGEGQTKEQLQQTIRSYFHTTLLDRYSVTMSLPANQAILCRFIVPFTEAKQIDQIILYEAERHIQSRPVEELVVDYHILKVEGQNSRLLVAAVGKELLEETVSWIEACEIYPFAMDLDLAGLFHLTKATNAFANQGGVILLDIHSEVCNMLALSQGQIIEARAIRIKVDSSLEDEVKDMRMTTALRLPIFAHEGVRRTEFLALGLKTKVFLQLIKEVRRTLFESQTLEAVYLCGEKELLEVLPVFLEKRLKVPVLAWDIASHIGIAQGVDTTNLGLAVPAIGLAIKALDKVDGGFNFRKATFACQKSQDILLKPLAAFLTLLFLLLALSAIYFYLAANDKASAYENLLAEVEKVYGRVNPGESLAAVNYWDRIYHVKRFLQDRSELSTDTLPKIQDVLPHWATLSHKIAAVREQYYFTVERLRIDPKEATVEGRTETDLCFDVLKQHLKQIPWVDDHEDSMRLIYSQVLDNPRNPKLPRLYKFWIRLKE